MWGDGGSSAASGRDEGVLTSHTQSFRVFSSQVDDKLDAQYLAGIEEAKRQEEARKKAKAVNSNNSTTYPTD
jgi:hypothetical protein